MKTMLMMRHAKSSWGSDVATDHERPLNKRGRRDAPVMAQLLCDHELVPQLIVSSDSRRTCETLELMQEVFKQFDHEPVVEIESSFYHAPAEEWLDKLVTLSDQFSSVTVSWPQPGCRRVTTASIGGLPHDAHRRDRPI